MFDPGKIALSFELGGSHAVAALVRGGDIVCREEWPVAYGAELAPLLPKLVQVAGELRRRAVVVHEPLLGAAISLAALIDPVTGRVVATNGKYSDSKTIDLGRWSEQELGLPLVLENDARMAVLGESYAGNARGAQSVLMLTLGTGIGGAMLIDGKPFRTAQPQAGCLGGHVCVNMAGRACNCGAIGCMEAEASTWALPLILRDWPRIETSALTTAPGTGFKQLFSCAQAGDAVAIAVRDHCIRVWCAGTVGLVHVYGPELILFGGGVMKAGDMILDRIRTYVEKHAWQPGQHTRIERAGLGCDAALYGAIPLLEQRLGSL